MVELIGGEEEIEALALAIDDSDEATLPGEVGPYTDGSAAAQRISFLIPAGARVLLEQIPGRLRKAPEQRRKQVADWVRSLSRRSEGAQVKVHLRPLGGTREAL
eukprot:5356057-Karenia_brevis.AAC.1